MGGWGSSVVHLWGAHLSWRLLDGWWVWQYEGAGDSSGVRAEVEQNELVGLENLDLNLHGPELFKNCCLR